MAESHSLLVLGADGAPCPDTLHLLVTKTEGSQKNGNFKMKSAGMTRQCGIGIELLATK